MVVVVEIGFSCGSSLVSQKWSREVKKNSGDGIESDAGRTVHLRFRVDQIRDRMWSLSAVHGLRQKSRRVKVVDPLSG
jgi:hypothetical protein